MGIADTPELLVADAAAWRDWLEAHHSDASGVFLVLAKKNRPAPTTLTYEQALQEALCQGWIDGQVRRRDDDTVGQRFTPRTARSPWSKANVERVARLEAEGRMRERGRAEVARAQADGRWEAAYAGPATIEVPDDLAAAVAASPRASAMWEVLTSQNRYAMLFRLHHLKTPAGRARRIADYVEKLERGETLHPQRARHPQVG